MRLVQITDSHLHADKEARSRAGIPFRQFERVLEAVIAERPDIVVFSGDVSQDETAASYTLACQALASLPCPWFWIPGNHDQLAFMQAEHTLVEEVDLAQWRLLLLDTHVEGQPYGELGAERLNALAERLEEDDRPTLIVMHHPPVDVGAVWMDAIGLQDRDAFWQLLHGCPQVKIILFGHAHQAYAQPHRTEDIEIDVYGCPAIADQFLPGAEQFAIDEASRPGYRIIDLHGSEWQTWVERVVV
ncbi:metallophosphoesterase [Halomonas sp. TD01]|uniref:metallophosphoesterase n=1 Tax=Halomonas sp. TD01 TaxID=999141 RepID=UPI000214F13F|nr:metallophosphoesterase [Halomonas sp. TD01]EGP20960.1 metallophosphoesterase [Halomonas sp. TD01]CAH1044075.1 3',5'-cyclic-nucleotide phosphodiesterase (EC [Halomonas sp. TD01]